jgi:hypothetical protein
VAKSPNFILPWESGVNRRSTSQLFLADKMQPDYFRRFSLVEMAIHRVADLLPKGVQRLCFGKDGLAQGASGKTAFHSFLDQENDFVHALQVKSASRLCAIQR